MTCQRGVKLPIINNQADAMHPLMKVPSTYRLGTINAKKDGSSKKCSQ